MSTKPDARARAAARAHRTQESTATVRRSHAADPALASAQRRYGGIDVPGSLTGMLAALALLIFIGSLVGAAIGAIGYQTGLDGNRAGLSIAGLAGGFVALLISYFVGGWTAGRIARYDGARNGIMTGIWTLVLAALLAAAGAVIDSRYDVFENVPNLPNWFSDDARTLGAVASGVGAVVAMLVGGLLGGRTGARYHERIDRLIADTRPGAISTGPSTRVVRPS